jgi:hypothetical protein
MADVLLNILSSLPTQMTSSQTDETLPACPDENVFLGLFNSMLAKGTTVTPEVVDVSVNNPAILTTIQQLLPLVVEANVPSLTEKLTALTSDVASVSSVSGCIAIDLTTDFADLAGSAGDDSTSVGMDLTKNPEVSSLLLGMLSLAVLKLNGAATRPEMKSVSVSVTDCLPSTLADDDETWATKDSTEPKPIALSAEDNAGVEMMEIAALLLFGGLQSSADAQDSKQLQVTVETGETQSKITPVDPASGKKDENPEGTLNASHGVENRSVAWIPGRVRRGVIGLDGFLQAAIDALSSKAGTLDSNVDQPEVAAATRGAKPTTPSTMDDYSPITWDKVDSTKKQSIDLLPTIANEETPAAKTITEKRPAEELFDRIVSSLKVGGLSPAGTDDNRIGADMKTTLQVLNRNANPDRKPSFATPTNSSDIGGGYGVAAGTESSLLVLGSAPADRLNARSMAEEVQSVVVATTVTVEKHDSTSDRGNEDDRRQQGSDTYAFMARPSVTTGSSFNTQKSLVDGHKLYVATLDRIEKMISQMSTKTGARDLTVKLDVGNNETVVVGLRDLGQSIAVEVKASNQALVTLLQSQKDAIVKQLEGKELRTSIFVDPNASQTPDRRERRDNTKRKPFGAEERTIPAFGSVVETFA